MRGFDGIRGAYGCDKLTHVYQFVMVRLGLTRRSVAWQDLTGQLLTRSGTATQDNARFLINLSWLGMIRRSMTGRCLARLGPACHDGARLDLVGLGLASHDRDRQDNATQGFFHKGANMQRKTIAERSWETERLRERLSGLAIDELVSYAELSALVGGNVQKERYGNLASARHILQQESGVVIDTIRCEGVKRVDDEGVVHGVTPYVKHIRRQSKKAIRRLICVKDFDGLSDISQIHHQRSMMTLSTIDLFTKPKSQKLIEAKIAADGRIDVGETLSLFAPKPVIKPKQESVEGDGS
jgi:hypothetical protein